MQKYSEDFSATLKIMYKSDHVAIPDFYVSFYLKEHCGTVTYFDFWFCLPRVSQAPSSQVGPASQMHVPEDQALLATMERENATGADGWEQEANEENSPIIKER